MPNDYPKTIRAITRTSVTKSPGKDATENETSGGRTRKRNDIAMTVVSCNKCQEHRPSQKHEPLRSEPLPKSVFKDVSADFFHYAGRDFLVYVDRLSGWPVVFHFQKGTTTSRHIIYAYRRAFVELRIPVRFRSDGGPQFASRQFNQFLKRWGVSGAPSSPHYHQSNGQAEAAVKAMKKLIATTTVKGDLDDENFQRGLLEYLECSYSPLRYVLKHVQYIRCVTFIMSFNTSEVDNALCCSTKAYDSSVRICCDGVLNWKGSTNACCTSRAYDNRYEMFCRYRLVSRDSNVAVPFPTARTPPSAAVDT